MRSRSYLDDRISVPQDRIADLTNRKFPETVLIKADGGLQVDAGDDVYAGQLISRSGDNGEAEVYSSVSGTVRSISESGGQVYIEIANDGSHKPDPGCVPFGKQLKECSCEDLSEIARKAGITEGSGSGEPLSEKIGRVSSKVDSLFIDCIGSNAYLPVPGRIARDQTASLLNGIKILMMATGARKTYIVAEDAGDGPLGRLKELAGKTGFVRVLGIKSRQIEYPHIITPEMVKKLTSDSAGRYAVFFPESCCDLYRAFSKGTPCISKTITVGGDCIGHSGNITVPLGTRISDIIRISGGTTEKPGRIVIGDPITGESASDWDETVTKTTDAVYILSEKVTPYRPPAPCIRCGKCDDACTFGVIPAYIVRNSGRGTRILRRYGAGWCTECGLCSCVCPSGIDILEEIRKAKRDL